jgi:hypothetical protein
MVCLFTKIATKLQPLSIPVTMLSGTPCEENYLSEDKGKLIEIILSAHEWGIFYPKRIEKEGKNFFYPYQEYFNKSEQEEMLAGFWKFDRKMIREKYNKVSDEYSRL